MPAVNPVMTSGLELPVAVNDPGVEVTVYPVIDFPPVAGAVNAIEEDGALPNAVFITFVAVGAEGVAGTVVAVIDPEVTVGPAPFALFPVKLNVYAVLLAKPVTVIGLVALVVVYDPGEDTAVNVAAPPTAPVGSVNVIVAAPLLKALLVPTSTAETLVGVPGVALSATHPPFV